MLVIASTHPRPGLPAELRPLSGDACLIEDPLAENALDPIQDGERVLIVGSGLTAADIVATLDRRGRSGLITVISRRGLRPRGHAARTFPPEGDFVSRPARTATRLLASVRRAVAEAAAEGRPWQPVLDAARAQGSAIWAALDPDARRRVVRHLRPFWDVHRFRIAPQIDAMLEHRLAEGTLVFRRARLVSAEPRPQGFRVALRDHRGTVLKRHFDRVVVATGPAHGDILAAQPYLQGLADKGFIALDPAGLGLLTATNARAIGGDCQADPTLFVAGPLARGTFGELMGLPQVSTYARFVADQLLAGVGNLSAKPTDAFKHSVVEWAG
jgi:uncharacterized NAD(P)/FAD-binding protein YdhS